MSYYLIESHIKQKINVAGKRMSKEALAVLDSFVDDALTGAITQFNGNSSLIDASLMSHVIKAKAARR